MTRRILPQPILKALAERSRSLCPVVEHTGDRSKWGNLRKGQRDLKEYNLSRECLRSRHIRATGLRTQADRKESVSMPIVARSRCDHNRLREDTVIIYESKTNVFDRLG
ncbi:hypothetical protein TIFTF001_027172 [Ficus carica]|uniref:Uncharacterized protein n=1 Tax=Ficus carica TaxID=3494 RepID=A0AA88DNP2_FICCA|nr:hypothetical protein TIFTF001_027172 [Ficus carica]